MTRNATGPQRTMNRAGRNGIVEFSHYAWCNIALSDAAKIGARYAMVRGSASSHPASDGDIESVCQKPGRSDLFKRGNRLHDIHP